MSNNYKPTKWLGGKTIGTAQVMNNIEQGISNAHDRLDSVENGILSVHNRLNNVDSQIKDKANLDSVFSMSNMGQDIKEAMTGGSVPVVDIDSILTENIVDKQVIPSKTNFFNIGKNLCNPDEIEIGRVQNDGTIDRNETGYRSTGWIAINKNDVGKYIVGQLANGKIIYNSIKFYDKSKVVIHASNGGGQLGTGTTPFVIPNGARYVRLSFGTLVENQYYYVQITDINAPVDNISRYTCKLKPELIEMPKTNLDIVTPDKTSFFDIGNNLANPRKFSVGRLQNDGTIDGNASYITTDFIAINKNDVGKYIVGQLAKGRILYHSVKFYKNDKSLIPALEGGGQMGTSTSPIKIPPGASFVRLSFSINDNQFAFVGINSTGVAFSEISKYVYRIKPEYSSVWYWYKNKKIAFYGDSITARGNWQNYVSEYFELKEWVNCGVGGSTVANVGADLDYDSNPNKQMCTDERIATIPLDSDVIVFFGGLNDWGAKVPIGTIKDGETTFKGAYMMTLKKLQKRCPNAIIVAMTPLNGRLNNTGVAQDYPMELSNGKTVREYAQAIIDVCNLYAIPCIDLNADCRINTLNAPNYLDDTIHQNLKGAKLIANSCINGLKRFEPIDFI